MLFSNCHIRGLIVIEPAIFIDTRGYFFEAYNDAIFKANGIANTFVQDNQSKSSFGVIRGLHYQLNPHAQSKLIRVLSGTILDVAVDIRRGSPTYGQHFAVELSAENNKQLFIPAGFAHGFSVHSETAVVLYKCDAFYKRHSEAGIKFNDEELNIDWKIRADQAIVSEKDQQLPSLKDCINNFQYEE
ncbi:MAG: dTDP-4-dehydrorhamnose 3,5-epimerase [Chitinophagaceae bacterium]|nr:dTDP-4-dehydrorhamnose 3,5-epimerase [Chitinophagaceae bacterium]